MRIEYELFYSLTATSLGEAMAEDDDYNFDTDFSWREKT